jgi:hypothetical protein
MAKRVEVFGVEKTVSGSDVREYFLGRYKHQAECGILKLGNVRGWYGASELRREQV